MQTPGLRETRPRAREPPGEGVRSFLHCFPSASSLGTPSEHPGCRRTTRLRTLVGGSDLRPRAPGLRRRGLAGSGRGCPRQGSRTSGEEACAPEGWVLTRAQGGPESPGAPAGEERGLGRSADLLGPCLGVRGLTVSSCLAVPSAFRSAGPLQGLNGLLRPFQLLPFLPIWRGLPCPDGALSITLHPRLVFPVSLSSRLRVGLPRLLSLGSVCLPSPTFSLRVLCPTFTCALPYPFRRQPGEDWHLSDRPVGEGRLLRCSRDPSPSSRVPCTPHPPVGAPQPGNGRASALLLRPSGTRPFGYLSSPSALLLLIRLKRAHSRFRTEENGNIFMGKRLKIENANSNFQVLRVLWNFREAPNSSPDDS